MKINKILTPLVLVAAYAFVSGTIVAASRTSPVAAYISTAGDAGISAAASVKATYQQEQTKEFSELFDSLKDSSSGDGFVYIRGGFAGLGEFLNTTILDCYRQRIEEIRGASLDTPWVKENTGLSFYLFQALHNSVLGMLAWGGLTFHREAVCIHCGADAGDALSAFYKSIATIDDKVAKALPRCFDKLNEQLASFEESRSTGSARERFARARGTASGEMPYHDLGGILLFEIPAGTKAGFNIHDGAEIYVGGLGGESLREMIAHLQEEVLTLRSRSSAVVVDDDRLVALERQLADLQRIAPRDGVVTQAQLEDAKQAFEHQVGLLRADVGAERPVARAGTSSSFMVSIQLSATKIAVLTALAAACSMGSEVGLEGLLEVSSGILLGGITTVSGLIGYWLTGKV